MCEKSDGIRYLLFMTADADRKELHFLIDRKNEYWEIWQRNLHIPTLQDMLSFHTRTLIDGELVMEKCPRTGRPQPKFLVFDCLVLDGKSLMQRSLDKRIGYFKQYVMRPYTDLFSRYEAEKATQAFLVEMKDMQFAYAIEMMFREVLPRLRHGNDGLIFTCKPTPYQHGTDPHILKWKPSSENTVDFRLQLEFPEARADDEDTAEGAPDVFPDYDAVPRARLLVYVGGERGGSPYRRFEPRPPFSGDLYLTDEQWATLKGLGDPLDERVVECGLDEQNRWVLHRFRDDKKEANHITTVQSVLDSIRDSVGEKELLEAAKSIKDNWKLRAVKRGEKG